MLQPIQCAEWRTYSHPVAHRHSIVGLVLAFAAGNSNTSMIKSAHGTIISTSDARCMMGRRLPPFS